MSDRACYRSDRYGRIQYLLHHHILEIAICVLAVAIPLGLWIVGDYGPIEILRAKGGL